MGENIHDLGLSRVLRHDTKIAIHKENIEKLDYQN